MEASQVVEWAKLSTSYYLDEAIAQAGEAAEVMFLRCIAYSGAKESRGRVSKAVLPMLAPTKTEARLAALIREGLLVEDGEHVLIRSWAAWQQSLDKESDRKHKDRDRKARVRGQSADSPRTSGGHSADSPADVRGLLSRDLEVEVERSNPLAAPLPKQRQPPKGTAVPDSWPPTPVLIAWAAKNAPGVDAKLQTEQWLDHHRSRGTTAKDWTASWRTWMRNAKKWERPPLLRAVGGGPTDPTNLNKEW